MKTVVVVAGGPDVPVGSSLPSGAIVIAADGGADHVRAAGLPVDLLVGDLDSVSSEAAAEITAVERHPAAKEATDLALALDAAVELEPERILVVGSPGGRLDHLLGSLLLLASGRYAGIRLDAQIGAAAVHVVRGERVLGGEPGELISLFALHGPAEDIWTEGLVYPLQGETLEPGSSRGTSNLFAAAEARISVGRGVLLAVRPSGSVSEESSP